jgi:glyoxylase-like metal-dependent hydrolase (beta-lactamase superfamily II)
MTHALAPGVRRLVDTCNVWVIERGGRTLLIDAGDGSVAETLGDRPVDWVLHTHHHREAAFGAALLADRGARLAVPAAEADRFADATGFWERLALDDRYDCANVFATLPADVPVSRRLDDYETLHWQGLEFLVLPTPGHTRGSVSYIVDIDGVRVAFCGGLIAAPGRVPTLFDLHWDYSNPDSPTT